MVVYLFVVIQIYNKFSGFLLFFTIIYNLSLEMSDEPLFHLIIDNNNLRVAPKSVSLRPNINSV